MLFDPHNGRLYLTAAGYAVSLRIIVAPQATATSSSPILLAMKTTSRSRTFSPGCSKLVDDGIADPERIAVMGWSNGGYLTNCLITLEKPPFAFKAASSGAGILDTAAEWGFNDEPAYPTVFKEGFPWQVPDAYRKTSPSFSLGNVKTPTLIHVGEYDVRCPPGHSRMLYRALNEYVKVPTELIVYPNEPHGLSRYKHRLAKMEWDLAWYAKYLK